MHVFIQCTVYFQPPLFLHLDNNVTIVNATYELNKSMNQCFETPVATLGITFNLKFQFK